MTSVFQRSARKHRHELTNQPHALATRKAALEPRLEGGGCQFFVSHDSRVTSSAGDQSIPNENTHHSILAPTPTSKQPCLILAGFLSNLTQK